MTLANTDAEYTLLGALMVDGRAVDTVADRLAPSDFAEPIHARLYDAIVRQASIGKPATAMFLRPLFEGDERLKELGGIGYLARMTGDFAGAFDAAALADMIAELSRRRQMQQGYQEAVADCGDFTLTPEQIVSRADAAVSETANEGIAQPSAADALGALLDNIGKPVKGVTCGNITQVDEALGPIRPKQLVIAAGRPGMGKTAFALSYALGAAMQGHGVLFVSLEMSAAELAERMAADLCFDGKDGVPYSAIRDNDLNAWQQRRVAQACSSIQDLPFQIIDAGHLTTGRLSALVRRHARRMDAKGHKLELIVVDYLQLLSPDGKPRSNYEAVSEVSRNLKAIAKDNGVGIMALAQLSRSVENRDGNCPQLSDLRDSGQIEQDADAVMFLLRQEYYLRQSEPVQTDPKRGEWESKMRDWQGVIEFIIAKRRNGTAGRTEGRFFGAYQAVRGQ